MRTFSFFSSLFLALSFSQSLTAVLASGSGRRRCRCLYGQQCWPSQLEFDALASQVSQPLVHPVPPASPCYASANSSECTQAVQEWGNGNWRANQTGAMQNVNFETFTFQNGTIEACYLNTTLGVPCGQGSVSVIGVDARLPSDVQAAILFAAKHNLRVAVKNTGHDYLGRSDGRGSFLIWTHNMKNIIVHPSFRPAGAPPTETYAGAMTLGAGVQWHEAYFAANASGRTLVGGASAGGSVGAAGGWLLGGGHSALSPSYGLGVDNVLEISLITSTGQYLTASAHNHSDLFWALRGGGGGTFGIVTSVTYRTRPSFPVVAAFVSASIAAPARTPNAALRAAFTELVRITPALTDAGWGGYSMLTANPATGRLSFTLFCIVPNVTWAEGNATILPYLEYVQSLATNASQSADEDDRVQVDAAVTVAFPDWYQWYTFLFTNGSQVGGNIELGSWLIPRDAYERDYETVANKLLDIQGGISYYLVAGGAVSQVPTSATGLNPAWRKAAAHVIVGTGWKDGATSDEINQLRETLKADTAKLRALGPRSGAYFNEASLFEPNPEHAFFGSHYLPLRAIKRVYDPIDLFIIAEGVGSSEWNRELTCCA